MKMRKFSAAGGAMGVALLLLFAGCNLGLSEDGVTAVDSEYDYETIPKEDLEVSAGQGAPFTATVSAVGTLQNDTDQAIKLEFANGVLDDGSVGEIRIYPLSDASAAYEAHVRGDAIEFSADIIALTNGDSEVYLTFDGSDIPTDKIEVYIPASVTAGGGLKALNQDGDSVAGESEDDVIEYLAVGGGLPAPVGQERNPRAGFSIANITFDDGGDAYDTGEYEGNATPRTAIVLEYSLPAGAAAADFDGSVSASDKIALQQRSSSTAAWEDVGVSVAAHDTIDNADLVTVSGELTDKHQYRWLVRNGWKSAAWNGYPLFWKGATDQHLTQFAERWDETEIAGFTYYESDVSSVNTSLGTTQPGDAAFIDITFTGLSIADDEAMVRDSVTAERFVVWNSDRQAELAIDSLQWVDVNTVRLRLAASSNNTAGAAIEVTIEPGILSEIDDGSGGRETVNAFTAPRELTGTL